MKRYGNWALRKITRREYSSSLVRGTMWGHWHPFSGLLVTFHLGFKARMDSRGIGVRHSYHRCDTGFFDIILINSNSFWMSLKHSTKTNMSQTSCVLFHDEIELQYSDYNNKAEYSPSANDNIYVYCLGAWLIEREDCKREPADNKVSIQYWILLSGNHDLTTQLSVRNN